MREILAIAVVVLLFFVVGVLMMFLGDGTPQKTATLLVGGYSFVVDIADTPQLHAKGLSGRMRMAQSRGMLFEFGRPALHSFWMKGMHFSLDFVWIRGTTVVGVTENAPPLRESEDPVFYRPPEPVDRVLEINAGLVKELGIAAGDEVRFEE